MLEDPREGQLKKIPVEGQVKKTPEVQVMKTPVEGQVKKTDPSSRQGRCPLTSTL
jgi:hypothetical protein